jgi:Domain of unknown function (DUF4188)
MPVDRATADLSAYPDLVMILLGMRVNAVVGAKTLLGFGPRIARAAQDLPDGLLSHETFLWSLFPPHADIRQYWRDFAALESWARSAPHREWWTAFLRDSGGTGFWHETYFMRGGIEAIYDDVKASVGLLRFAPVKAARGAMFSARRRLKVEGEPAGAPAVSESQLYRNE